MHADRMRHAGFQPWVCQQASRRSLALACSSCELASTRGISPFSVGGAAGGDVDIAVALFERGFLSHEVEAALPRYAAERGASADTSVALRRESLGVLYQHMPSSVGGGLRIQVAEGGGSLCRTGWGRVGRPLCVADGVREASACPPEFDTSGRHALLGHGRSRGTRCGCVSKSWHMGGRSRATKSTSLRHHVFVQMSSSFSYGVDPVQSADFNAMEGDADQT